MGRNSPSIKLQQGRNSPSFMEMGRNSPNAVASVIVGKLSSEECTKPIVLTVEQLQKANF